MIMEDLQLNTADYNVTWKDVLSLRDLKEFPLVDKSLDPIYKRIYPIMQRKVWSVLQAVKDYNVRVIIFGSSVTMLCNVTSDLDICIETQDYNLNRFHEMQAKIQRSTAVACDVIYYNTLQSNDKLKMEIDKNGVVVKEMV